MNQNDLTFARSFCIATQVEVISDPVPDQSPSFANSIRRSINAASTPSDAEAGSGSGNERNDAKSYEGSARDQSKTISPDEAENPPQHDHAAPTVTRSKSNKIIDRVFFSGFHFRSVQDASPYASHPLKGYFVN
jgi:hypothetical protein